MIYTLTLNPAIDKTAEIADFTLGSVNRITSLRIDVGGKGINVSKVIKTLGGKSVAMGIVGGSGGDMICNYLEEQGIEFDFIKTDYETRVNFKIIDTDNKVNTDINESGNPISAEDVDEVFRKLDARIKPNDIVVIAGSVPKGAPFNIYAKLVRLCNAHEALAILDADGVLLCEGIKSKPFLIKPNIDELRRMSKKELTSVCDIATYAKSIVDSGIPNVVVSLGGDGALFCSKDGIYHAHGLKVAVRSTVGAGDSMVAAICYALENGYSISQTMTLAVATSAANVTCSGTQSADYSLIESLMKRVVWEKL